MKNLNELYEKIKNTNLTVLSARTGNHMPVLLSQIIIELGINCKKKISIFMNGNASWLTTHIASNMMGEPFSAVNIYLNPLTIYKAKKRPPIIEELIPTLEKLYMSDISLEDLNLYEKNYASNPASWFEDDELLPDFLILYMVENFLSSDTYSPQEILSEIEKLTKRGTKVIIVAKMERRAEEKLVQNFENIHNYNDLRDFTDTFITLSPAIPRKKDTFEIKTSCDSSVFLVVYQNSSNRLVDEVYIK